jgi:hypothetical protein
VCARDNGIELAQTFKSQDLTCEHEAIAGHELLDQIFLDLAEHAARDEHASRLKSPALEARQQHADHRRLDNGPHIEAI